ncbi:MAG: nucleoside triphosphate pyrophosphohydrolase [candidate division WOR-3 bacterium]|nr:nucleoside triphosphate pyrophosphohydrolase [candidate division WOR-3 bacterium]
MNLREIVARLRSQCPWDRKQTLSSIRHLYIEEAHELSEALESGDGQKIAEEFGDLLYIVLMGIEIARDAGLTDYDRVEEMAKAKLIRRHPHVFGETKVEGEAEVLANWERIKEAEKRGEAGFFEGIPKSLPALIRAQMMQERAARIGFDWESAQGPLAKVREETQELTEHIGKETDDLERELGDLLFSVVNLARHIGVRAEESLERSNRKFERRFEGVRRFAQERGLDLTKMDIEELDKLWDEVKEAEH